jgi:hypothetical protein
MLLTIYRQPCPNLGHPLHLQFDFPDSIAIKYRAPSQKRLRNLSSIVSAGPYLSNHHPESTEVLHPFAVTPW